MRLNTTNSSQFDTHQVKSAILIKLYINTKSIKVLTYVNIGLLYALKKVDLLPKVKIPNKFIFERVEQSPKNRRNVFSKEDIKNVLSKIGQSKIRNSTSQL